mmetsp:Transcript_235/g.581  ORF Transcript_235/g.581 Transcript_235/m.581 type:complete len:251 (-) Transcript_235:46-798(-)
MAGDAADEGDHAVAQFPPLPAYFKAYGPSGGELHPLALSREPPKPPIGRYRCFGDVWDPDEKQKTLEEEGRPQLFEYPKDGSPLNYVAEVKRLCSVTMEKYTAFLAALRDMDQSAPSTKEKAEEFETIFINLLYLVNQLRPAQGRQILIDSLKRQVNDRRSTAQQLRELVTKGEESIKAALTAAAETVKGGTASAEHGKPSSEGEALSGPIPMDQDEGAITQNLGDGGSDPQQPRSAGPVNVFSLLGSLN